LTDSPLVLVVLLTHPGGSGVAPRPAVPIADMRHDTVLSVDLHGLGLAEAVPFAVLQMDRLCGATVLRLWS
jgi:hypothetical protein